MAAIRAASQPSDGSLVFDGGYLGKPLVFCGTCGIMPVTLNGEPSYMKKARKGDLIVMVGGRIGKDGIHGATSSSEELSETSPTSAVQIGDPITQKRMTDFLLDSQRPRPLYCYYRQRSRRALIFHRGDGD